MVQRSVLPICPPFLCSFFLLTYFKRALSLKTRQTFLSQWFIFGRIGLRSTPSHIWSMGITDLFSYGSVQVLCNHGFRQIYLAIRSTFTEMAKVSRGRKSGSMEVQSHCHRGYHISILLVLKFF